MGRTSIEWTAGDDGAAGMTWNPLRARDRATGKVGHYCEMISPGCAKCYAGAFQPRFGLPVYTGPGHREERLARLEPFLDEKTLLAPLRWKQPRRVFVCSMTDLFLDVYPDEWIDRVFAIMALAPQHTHMVLTKRPGRMRDYLSWSAGACNMRCPTLEATASRLTKERGLYDRLVASSPWMDPNTPWRMRWPLPNVWLGVSVEDQQRAEERVPVLLDTPAAVRFVSAEPLLSAVDLRRYLRLARADLVADAANACARAAFASPDAWALHWVIVGGESGPGARPMLEEWVRSLRDQCAAAAVPFFYKQKLDGGRKVSLPPLDGRRWAEFPRPPGGTPERFEVHEDDGEVS